MENEQLNSNLNELIKNQIEICEKLDKVCKVVKKLRPKKTKEQKQSDDLFELMGLKKIVPFPLVAPTFKQSCDFKCEKIVDNGKDLKYEVTFTNKPTHYLCIKDFNKIKEGTVLKWLDFDIFHKCDMFEWKVSCGFKETAGFTDISKMSEHFIPIQQFETLKEGQEVEFTLRNGKSYKTKVVRSIDDTYYLDIVKKSNTCPYYQLNKAKVKKELVKKYGNTYWPTTTLEDLTNDLNTLICLPDLTVKEEPKSEVSDIRKQANELVDKFIPLVNILSVSLKQSTIQVAIKCAIVHCKLNIEKSTHGWCQLGYKENHYLIKENHYLIKELQKMLSE